LPPVTTATLPERSNIFIAQLLRSLATIMSPPARNRQHRPSPSPSPRAGRGEGGIDVVAPRRRGRRGLQRWRPPLPVLHGERVRVRGGAGFPELLQNATMS